MAEEAVTFLVRLYLNLSDEISSKSTEITEEFIATSYKLIQQPISDLLKEPTDKTA